MSRFKKLSKVRCQQPLVCWHGSVAFPILPIHIANVSRLSKCTLPIISIPKPLKLSNSQISYPIWQMSILMCAWRVSDNEVYLRSDVFLNSCGGGHAITLQWCPHSNKISIISHSYVSAFWLQSHILRCGHDGTPMFWNAKPAGRDNIACCACALFPDGALGKIIAARKHRALAGCKREGAVCICKTLHFLSFITNEQYEPRNGELYYLVYKYIYLLKFLMNNLFSCCFEITITPGG